MSHRFDGGLSLFQGVDLTVRRGEIAALVGPSGCGKTTLLAKIARILPTGSGTVRFGGRDLAAMRDREFNAAFLYIPRIPSTCSWLRRFGRNSNCPEHGLWRRLIGSDWGRGQPPAPTGSARGEAPAEPGRRLGRAQAALPPGRADLWARRFDPEDSGPGPAFPGRGWCRPAPGFPRRGIRASRGG
ncbi:MAG: ATP-binding cassette domain-containing protein [Candidatus Moduliflexus flocculans]|nr:ATP-binding cassette domain-containing protein [Candidatus Moduliflexus flocculans]